MIYKKLNKRPKRSKNKIKKGSTIECNCQSRSLSPNGFKKVSKATRTRHKMKDKELSEQIINKNFDQYRDFNDFDEDFNQQFINEQEIDNTISSCTPSESDSDSFASLNKIGRICILFNYIIFLNCKLLIIINFNALRR